MAFIVGKLRNRIQILQGHFTPNSLGGADKTYKKLIRIWAGIKYLN